MCKTNPTSTCARARVCVPGHRQFQELLSACVEFEKLLRTYPGLTTNTSVTAFSSFVTAMCLSLGCQGRRTVEEAAESRKAFIALGGPSMLQTLLHTPIMGTCVCLCVCVSVSVCVCVCVQTLLRTSLMGTFATGSTAAGMTMAHHVRAQTQHAHTRARTTTAVTRTTYATTHTFPLLWPCPRP